jgi:hypothetical protein
LVGILCFAPAISQETTPVPGDPPTADLSVSPESLEFDWDLLEARPAGSPARGWGRSPRFRSPLLPEPLADPRERPVTFLGLSSISGELRLDIPAGAELELGGKLGVRIGNLRYTGFDLGDQGADNTLSFDLSPEQRAAWGLAESLSGGGSGQDNLPGFEAVRASLVELGRDLAGLPPDQALALAGETLRAVGVSLLTSGDGLESAVEGGPALDSSLVSPLTNTLDSLLEHFYYERPGEIGFKNLELRAEAAGTSSSQYRYRTAGGDEVYAEIARSVNASTDDTLAVRVLYPSDAGVGSTAGTSALQMLYQQRSSSGSTSFNSFTVGRNRWSLGVSEIEHDLEFSSRSTHLAPELAGGSGALLESTREQRLESEQVESRIWVLRRGWARGWDLEMGAGLGSLRTRVEESGTFETTSTSMTFPEPAAAAPLMTEAAASLSAIGGGAGAPELPALEGQLLETDRTDRWLAGADRSQLGAGFLLGARRSVEHGETGLRAISFGRLRQQVTAAAGARLPLGRLTLVGDLQADWLRQPGVAWNEDSEEYRLEPSEIARMTPTAAVVWSLEPGALSSLHSWQTPFESRSRLRDPRHLGRALFAGSAGSQGDEMFAGYSFGRGTYLSASTQKGEGSYRHYTLSGRARSLQLAVGMGSGQTNGLSAQDERKHVGLSYLQFVYNREGERFFSLTLDPDRRGLDVTMVADSASLARSLGRAWTRLRRLVRL